MGKTFSSFPPKKTFKKWVWGGALPQKFFPMGPRFFFKTFLDFFPVIFGFKSLFPIGLFKKNFLKRNPGSLFCFFPKKLFKIWLKRALIFLSLSFFFPSSLCLVVLVGLREVGNFKAKKRPFF